MRAFLACVLLLVSLVARATQEPAEPKTALEVLVDDRCRVVTQDRANPSQTYSRPRFRPDPGICTMEGPHSSERWQETIVNSVFQRTRYAVNERTWVLHNPARVTLRFIVEQPVPKAWTIDSDPQPAEQEESLARFFVVVQPGETVRLHVGMRH